jgi:hypothetical protein
LKILFLHGWNSIPGGVKPTFLKNAGHEVINPALDDDKFELAVRTAQDEYDQHQPDVIVGSSRGGAVTMNIDSGDTPLVLLCPAWKNWGPSRKIKPNSMILHSRQDDVIPFADSGELVAISGLPPETLIEVGNDHRLADPDPLKAMLDACEMHIKSFGPKGSLGNLIETLAGWQREWRSLHGWAPKDVAEVLEESRLDWLQSLAHTLSSLDDKLRWSRFWGPRDSLN